MDLVDALRRIGYDSRLGPLGSVTYRRGTNPQTVPLAPLAPGFVMVPEDRPLNPEEVAHESTHVTGGMPMAAMGKAAGSMMGTNSYTDPDEIMAYLSQPSSPDTTTDMKTIEALSSGGGVYDRLVAALARLKRK